MQAAPPHCRADLPEPALKQAQGHTCRHGTAEALPTHRRLQLRHRLNHVWTHAVLRRRQHLQGSRNAQRFKETQNAKQQGKTGPGIMRGSDCCMYSLSWRPAKAAHRPSLNPPFAPRCVRCGWPLPRRSPPKAAGRRLQAALLPWQSQQRGRPPCWPQPAAMCRMPPLPLLPWLQPESPLQHVYARHVRDF